MVTSIACHETTSAPVPAKLAFIVQPTAITSQQVFPVSVAIQDAEGNTATTATNTVTLSIVDGTEGGNLSGTVSVAAVNGVATFTNLSIGRAATYSLSATSPNLASATSVEFTVRAGPPGKLSFTSQPQTAFAHATLPTVTIEVQDAAGNIVKEANNQVTLVLGSNPSGASLFGGNVRVTSNGVAAFSNLSIDRTRTGYTLVASSPGFPLSVSARFDVTTGAATKLAFATQPTTTAPSTTISPAVVVEVQDDYTNRVPTGSYNITLSIGTNGGGGVCPA